MCSLSFQSAADVCMHMVKYHKLFLTTGLREGAVSTLFAIIDTFNIQRKIITFQNIVIENRFVYFLLYVEF